MYFAFTSPDLRDSQLKAWESIAYCLQVRAAKRVKNTLPAYLVSTLHSVLACTYSTCREIINFPSSNTVRVLTYKYKTTSLQLLPF